MTGENPMNEKNSAIVNEIANIEELEPKTAPSGSWAVCD
jgi:hypothetical protein